MTTAPRISMLLAALIGAALPIGCSERSATPSAAPELQLAQAVGETAEGTAADGGDARMAEKLGMTPEELAAKKQMMMDAGMSAEEIAKALMIEGGGLAEEFKDEVESNVDAPDSIDDLIFFRSEDEKKFALKDLLRKEKNIVLVFTRGYSGGRICPFCATQTAQLAANKKQFDDLDANVLIIYPGSQDHLPEFEKAVAGIAGDTELPPVLLDTDLTAVNLLDIAADLASPSTFIIDKQGKVVFSYVGANRSDRPSVRAILAQLQAIQPPRP